MNVLKKKRFASDRKMYKDESTQNRRLQPSLIIHFVHFWLYEAPQKSLEDETTK